jgi:hypothetical protein
MSPAYILKLFKFILHIHEDGLSFTDIQDFAFVISLICVIIPSQLHRLNNIDGKI